MFVCQRVKKKNPFVSYLAIFFPHVLEFAFDMYNMYNGFTSENCLGSGIDGHVR
jgi:hypothetical protein